MAYSKEELEQFIKADEKSCRNYEARMDELRARAKELADEARRLEESQDSSRATDTKNEE